MFNYKRLTFLLLLLCFILTITDSQLERQARRSLLSLVNIVVEEGSTVSETAPSSFLDSMETGRINLYNFFNKQDDVLGAKVDASKGILSVFFGIAYYAILLVKFLTAYVITFYPFVILMFYLFFTSPFFRKNEFCGKFLVTRLLFFNTMKKIKGKDFSKLSLASHKKFGGKLELVSKFKLKNSDDLSIAYTPGVADVCTQIFKDKNSSANVYTLKKNTVAVITDGSAVLGLGNIGAFAAIPVMEGKAVLMKHFAGVDSFPISLNTQNVEEIIQTIKNIEPVFGGINLEDISAPRCFEIEERLKEELNIPVMHDDQWGAATVTVAALINALKVVKKKNKNVSVCLVGAGAAGIATAKLLEVYGVKNLTVFDSVGAINLFRSDLSEIKKSVAKMNTLNLEGNIKENMHNFDVFIGLSKPNLLTSEDVKNMKNDSIIFALAHPSPEILPKDAMLGGARIIGTGRSDFPNQINNSIFFPGFWRGVLDKQNKNKQVKNMNNFDKKLFIKCAEAIASCVKPTANKILPSTLDKKVHKKVADTVLRYK